MPRIPVPSKVIRGFQYVLENDFTGGLKTEFTGLNFPENACTSTENCTFFHTGAVFRRNGFDYESGFRTNHVDRTNSAISTYIWTNVGGDGSTKISVAYIAGVLFFYQLTNANTSFPISTSLLPATVALGSYLAPGVNALDATIECQFTSGNGYLFVFHPSINPIYCTYAAGTITANTINVQTRDFVGCLETPSITDSTRPNALTLQHQYNLQNQGWTTGAAWQTSSTSAIPLTVGSHTWTVGAGLTVTNGDTVTVLANTGVGGAGIPPNLTFTAAQGTVTGYSGTSLTLNLSGVTNNTALAGQTFSIWSFNANASHIAAWQAAVGNYPSNADVWWTFKNSTGVFSPSTTIANVTLGSGPAPKGFYILDAFNQTRTLTSGVTQITDVTTTTRPKTGTWFQGRVWYTGVNASFPAVGNAAFSTWSENIYFSQIITNSSQFGRCYQTNDPTSETLFDILPSDGGVITIQGSGNIYKLFPITNGLLVFAANGIWFITGSQGIGFTATDYTISKLSAIQNISSTSYVDVLGYPMFWNEEGIYQVGLASEQQGISVNSLTLNTIKQFYDAIPIQSKMFARGSYNPITGQVQWAYRSTVESTVTDRYQFDSVLNFSMFTQAFYPWQISAGPYIHDVQYISYSGRAGAPLPGFKYLTSNLVGVYTFTFSEERDNVLWKDWNSTGVPTDYSSFFVTGYRLHGDAQRKWQPGYVYMYSDNTQNTSYKIQGRWDYAISGSSGKFSTNQLATNTVNVNNFSKVRRRHRIRGRGTVLQFQISNVSGKPFHIDGWSVSELQNAGP